ncbi:MAG TPA: MarR family transcriptional regulator, partial [Alphaproteobacteria bacterium]|nr:MarR family transcriptional regulator [Alphaproteobacteria bacterium]
KALQRWNELLARRFAAAGIAEVRPAYGSILIPLYEEDGLRMGELARRARLSKQTMTTMIRKMERAGLVRRAVDPEDGRAFIIRLSQKALRFRAAAERALAGLERALARAAAPAATRAACVWLETVARLAR